MSKILAVTFLLTVGVWCSSDMMYWEGHNVSLEVGARKCKPNEYPFMVFFTDKKCVPTLCSGALISTEWVLTSKECVEKKIDTNNCLVIAGTNYLSSDLWNENTVKFMCLLATTHSEGNLGLVQIETIHPFPAHLYLIPLARHVPLLQPPPGEAQEGEKTENNMTLFHDLSKPCNGIGGLAGTSNAEGVDPVDPRLKGWVEELAFVLGFQTAFGKTRRNLTAHHETNKKLAVPSLRRVVLPLLREKQCARNISEILDVNSVLCTWCYFGGSKSCLMDTGGPLVSKGQLVGIVSGPQAKHCFLRESVAVYTKVSLYSDWIDGELQARDRTNSLMSNTEQPYASLRKFEPVEVDQSSGQGVLWSPLLLGLAIVIFYEQNC